MVRQAMLTAVKASISTPVWPATLTSAITRKPQGSRLLANSTPAPVMAKGWQSGMSSCVFLAAMMPASRAAASTSPFLAVPVSTKSKLAGAMATKPSARATRSLTLLPETSTMRASPFELRCESLPISCNPRWRLDGCDAAAPPRGLPGRWPQPCNSPRPGAARSASDGQNRRRRPPGVGPPVSCRPQQCARGGGHVRCPHQRLPDQEGVHTGLGQPLEIGQAGNAAFGHDDAVVGNARSQSLRGLERRLEGLQVAIVDPNQSAVESQRTVELLPVVHLGNGIHVPGLGVGA